MKPKTYAIFTLHVSALPEVNKMKKSNRKIGIVFGILILIAICLLVAMLVYLSTRAQTVLSRPLVLIHNPLNQDIVEVGQGTLIHATARNKAGITRMELWADGALVDTKTPPAGGSANPLVLSTNWQPATSGKHLLVVRAYASSDVSGQATVQVEAVESTVAHTVVEGETLDEIAETYGVSAEEVAGSNPDLPAGGEPAPGDVLDIPAGGDDEADPAEPAGEADEAPAEDEDTTEDAPPADGTVPGDWLEVLDFFLDIDWGSLLGDEAPRPRSLYMEILDFDVLGAYDDTNCYASLGGNPWDLSEVAGASQYFEWLDDQPLDLDIACVGIASGGTDSVDLGRIAMRIPPEHWDGIRRTATSAGGGFRIEYRVSNSDDIGVEPLWLDPDMTPPTNLMLDEHRQGLSWEYRPEPGEEEIYGFGIYLNGNLQWVERYDGHIRNVSDLPPEWLHPPCGEQYIFTVTAVGYGFPDAPESLPALPPVIVDTPEDECNFEVMVTFYDLITHDLGGDGDARDRTGDVGPVYGYFFANEQQATFDTGSLQHRWGSVDRAVGISHNTTYDLSIFAADETRSWYGFPTLTTEVPEGENLLIGFHIMDEDSGRCNWSGDPDCDDLVCEGEVFYTHDEYSPLYNVQEGRIMSDNRRCEVSFRVEPAGDSPIGVPGGYTPAPFLHVTNMTRDDSTGNLLVEVANSGTATWSNHDLWTEIVERDGEVFRKFILAPGFRLEPGGSRVLDTGLRASLNYCVVLDPDNLIPESVEISGAMSDYRPTCPDLPDLEITDAVYDAGAEALEFTVRNNCVGTLSDCGDMDNRTVEITIPHRATQMEYAWSNISLASRDTITLTMPGIDVATHDAMGTYTVTLDPGNRIAESNESNNTYEVEGRHHYWISWISGCSDYFERWRINHIYMSLTADVVGGSASRRVADWSAPEIWMGIPSGGYRTGYDECWYGSEHPGDGLTEIFSEQFYLAGDEELILHLSSRLEAGVREWNMGTIEWVLVNPTDTYLDRTYPRCEAEPFSLGSIFRGADESGNWSSTIQICRYD